MPIPLQQQIVYGPVNSRRLGKSLGINLLPVDRKLCSFNCLYCQYGWTEKPAITIDQSDKLPSREEVKYTLESELIEHLKSGTGIDYITFSGNGEPTLHPQLGEIAEDVKKLKKLYFPSSKLAILSNSTMVHIPEIREALDLLDVRIMKLEAGSEQILKKLNRPFPSISLSRMVDGLKRLKDLIVQSLFIKGINDGEDEISKFIENLNIIKPRMVQVYTFNRPPAMKELTPVTGKRLLEIASYIELETGIRTLVY